MHICVSVCVFACVLAEKHAQGTWHTVNAVGVKTNQLLAKCKICCHSFAICLCSYSVGLGLTRSRWI